VWLGGLDKLKNPVPTSGNEPATEVVEIIKNTVNPNICKYPLRSTLKIILLLLIWQA
jgi:hypothetical protein